MRERFHDHLILRFFIGKKSESPFNFPGEIFLEIIRAKKIKKDPEFPVSLHYSPTRPRYSQ